MKEEAEERTRQILLEKVKEAELAADEARRLRLRRNTSSAIPQDEIIAASVQNVVRNRHAEKCAGIMTFELNVESIEYRSRFS